MAKSPKIFDSANLENWYLYNDSFRRQEGVRLLTDTPECKEFLWHFRPHTGDYSSSLNPIFLPEIPNLDVLARRPSWLIRDGLVPLLWFFRNYPKPNPNQKVKIFVHQELASAIPPAWLKNVGSYRLVTHFQEGLLLRPQKLRFLFTGLVTEGFCTSKHIKENLVRLNKQFGAEFKKAEKILCFFMRQDGYIPEDQSSFQVQFMHDLLTGLGENIKVFSLEELKAVADWEGAYFCDWNERRILADSYMAHLCLSKGARLLEHGVPADWKKPQKLERYVALSPYHGMAVCDQIKEVSPKERPQIDAEIERVMMSGSNSRYPWPRWLVEWSQEAQLS